MFRQQSQNRNRLVLAAAIAGGLFWSGVGLPLPAQAQGPDPSTQLYVQDIGVVYWEIGGPKRLPIAFVYIVDGNGQPVNGALVAGDWSGCLRQRNDSALTQTICHTGDDGELICRDGIARIEANKWVSCMKPCYITFTITSVSKPGMTYVPVEGKTSDTELCL
jgi:hypothetical protein